MMNDFLEAIVRFFYPINDYAVSFTGSGYVVAAALLRNVLSKAAAANVKPGYLILDSSLPVAVHNAIYVLLKDPWTSADLAELFDIDDVIGKLSIVQDTYSVPTTHFFRFADDTDVLTVYAST